MSSDGISRSTAKRSTREKDDMPKHSGERASPPESGLQDHLAAAERALREVARAASSKAEEAGAERHADVVAQIQREFRGRPLSEGSVGSGEAVDALLAGTDALRLKADG
jgi:hypothetical protein